jgi:predicted dehydrogenase
VQTNRRKDDKMRFLVIGAGSMGKRRARNLKALGYTDINMYDINYPENTSIDGVFFVSQNWKPETVFELGKYDAVIVSTPPLTKQAYIDLANKYNIPVFCEADVTLYNGNYHSSNTMRFHPAIQKIKELIDNGTLGKIYTFTHHCGNHINDWHPGCDKKTYYAMKKETGGCKEIFPFELSWLSYLFGSLTDCTGFINKKLNDPDISADDVYSASVKFERVEFPPQCMPVFIRDIEHYKSLVSSKKTITGTVLIDIVSRPAIRELRIVGEKCNLLWNWDTDYIELEQPDGEISMVFYPKGTATEGYNSNICEEMYQNELKSFIKSITPCCGDCVYIDPKEDHPRTTDHMCTKFNHRLMHGRYHPYFFKLNECKQYLFSREDEMAVMTMLRKMEKII